jgi:hypothetical protein
MKHADDIAGLSTSSDPPQDRSAGYMPPHTGGVLSVLHVLLAYARHISLTLDSRAVRWGFSMFAQFFGTAQLPVIRARLARGILRIMALQRVLYGRAMRGRDLYFPTARERSAPKPKPPAPPASGDAAGDARDDAPKPPRRRLVRRRYTDTTPDLDNLPSLAELEAEIRRRGVGAALTDICRDLGVSPRLCQGNFWYALQCYIMWCRGNLYRLVKDLNRQETAFEAFTNPTPPLCLPECTRDAVPRMLGFVIGDRWPVMPDPRDAPPGMLVQPRPLPRPP